MGYAILQSNQFTSKLGDQHLSGALSLDINIANGVPLDMQFDISGSSLYIHDVKVTGNTMKFRQPYWFARIDLDKAKVKWKKPIQIDVEATVSLLDSRPLTALLANQRARYGWLERLLTVEDIQGEALFKLSSDELRITHALAGNDSVDIGIKGLINAYSREGVVYARFKNIGGILKIKDGERRFDLLRAKKKFTGYIPGDSDTLFGNNMSSD